MLHNQYNEYRNPLATRYASTTMRNLFSEDYKFRTWRKLWAALAQAQCDLGLFGVTQDRVDQIKSLIEKPIDYQFAEEKEALLRHDVMSHIHEVAHQVPDAGRIIHLGATSCFVTDNTELIQMREGLKIIKGKLLMLMSALAAFANKYKNLPTLGFTHYQPAQLTTVGKRACLWLQDFEFDLLEINRLIETLPFRGAKGTTGTQASYLALFNGDHDKVVQLDQKVSQLMGFSKSLPITGQTYTRKIDFQVLSSLCGIAQSAHKMATDIRLLSNLKEIEEPFESSQVGSSAMAYKRNPMRCERICSLARFTMSLLSNAQQTASIQWFERTLDDSANRRISIPESFLSIDAILQIGVNVIQGAKVWPLVIRKHVEAELPFMASENILMEAVARHSGDRQELHEVIREFSLEAGRKVKEEGEANDFVSRVKGDSRFAGIDVDGILSPEKYVGRSAEQVTSYLVSLESVLKEVEESGSKLEELRV